MQRIILENIQKRYHQNIVLNDFYMEFPLKNDVVSLLGPNGAGKTTIMKLLAGILFINDGSILYIDEEENIQIKNKDYITWANQNIAYLSPDERYLSFKNSAKDNILYYAFLKGIDRQKVICNMYKFSQLLTCEFLLDKRVEQLSTGQKKVIKILSVFCTELPVLLLDEPTLGIDVDVKENLIDCINTLVKHSNSKIIVSSHDLDFVSRVTHKHIFIFKGIVKARIEKQYDYQALLELYRGLRGE